MKDLELSTTGFVSFRTTCGPATVYSVCGYREMDRTRFVVATKERLMCVSGKNNLLHFSQLPFGAAGANEELIAVDITKNGNLAVASVSVQPSCASTSSGSSNFVSPRASDVSTPMKDEKFTGSNKAKSCKLSPKSNSSPSPSARVTFFANISLVDSLDEDSSSVHFSNVKPQSIQDCGWVKGNKRQHAIDISYIPFQITHIGNDFLICGNDNKIHAYQHCPTRRKYQRFTTVPLHSVSPCLSHIQKILTTPPMAIAVSSEFGRSNQTDFNFNETSSETNGNEVQCQVAVSCQDGTLFMAGKIGESAYIRTKQKSNASNSVSQHGLMYTNSQTSIKDIFHDYDVHSPSKSTKYYTNTKSSNVSFGGKQVFHTSVRLDGPLPNVTFLQKRRNAKKMNDFSVMNGHEDVVSNNSYIAVAGAQSFCAMINSKEMLQNSFYSQLGASENMNAQKSNTFTNLSILKDSTKYDTVTCVKEIDLNWDGSPELAVGTYGSTLLVYSSPRDGEHHWSSNTTSNTNLNTLPNEQLSDVSDDSESSKDKIMQNGMILQCRKQFSAPVVALNSGDVFGEGVDSLAVSTMRGMHIMRPSLDEAEKKIRTTVKILGELQQLRSKLADHSISRELNTVPTVGNKTDNDIVKENEVDTEYVKNTARELVRQRIEEGRLH